MSAQKKTQESDGTTLFTTVTWDGFVVVSCRHTTQTNNTQCRTTTNKAADNKNKQPQPTNSSKLSCVQVFSSILCCPLSFELGFSKFRSPIVQHPHSLRSTMLSCVRITDVMKDALKSGAVVILRPFCTFRLKQQHHQPNNQAPTNDIRQTVAESKTKQRHDVTTLCTQCVCSFTSWTT